MGRAAHGDEPLGREDDDEPHGDEPEHVGHVQEEVTHAIDVRHVIAVVARPTREAAVEPVEEDVGEEDDEVGG